MNFYKMIFFSQVPTVFLSFLGYISGILSENFGYIIILSILCFFASCVVSSVHYSEIEEEIRKRENRIKHDLEKQAKSDEVTK